MGVSKAQLRAKSKYETKTYDKVLLRMKKGERDNVKAKADEIGESLNEFILKAINERIERME